MNDLALSALTFEDGEPIPKKHASTGENASPSLSISGVSKGTQSLLLVFDDLGGSGDGGDARTHWIVWNVDPAIEEIPRGWTPADDGAVEGQNDFGERGYAGPTVPEDGRQHAYRFRLYALDVTIDAPAGATKTDVVPKLGDYVVDQAGIEGVYPPRGADRESHVRERTPGGS